MTEVDYFRQLNLKFEECSAQQGAGVALRAALRNFPPPNFGGNVDVSRKVLFNHAQLLLRTIVQWRFRSPETFEALARSLFKAMENGLTPESAASIHAAKATYYLDLDSARKAVESTLTAFASTANREQYLYAKTLRDWSSPHAYNSAASTIAKVCSNDFEGTAEGVFYTPLWIEQIQLNNPPEELRNFNEFFGGSSFSFWREWRQGFIDGQPLDWDLQRRIALIDDMIWNEGPNAVSGAIEKIRARWQTEKALADLKDSLITQANARHGIGGNNPPESIEDGRLAGAVTLIWEAEDELSTALREENPTRERIESILDKFKAGLAGLLKRSTKMASWAVGGAIVFGTSKFATAVTDAYLAKHPEKIDAVIKAIENWLPYLS